MEKLITRKEAAKILGISIATLDAARQNGLISYVQYVPNGCVYEFDVAHSINAGCFFHFRNSYSGDRKSRHFTVNFEVAAFSISRNNSNNQK